MSDQTYAPLEEGDLLKEEKQADDEIEGLRRVAKDLGTIEGLDIAIAGLEDEAPDFPDFFSERFETPEESRQDRPEKMEEHKLQKQTKDRSKNHYLFAFITGVAVGVGMDIVTPFPNDGELEQILLFSTAPGLGVGLSEGFIRRSVEQGVKHGTAAFLGAFIGKSLYQLAKLYM